MAASSTLQGTALRGFNPEIRKASVAVELIPGASGDDVTGVIYAAYRQVFGNAHIMESERVVAAESQLRSGNISVREFVRSLAKSELYRSRFVDGCSRYRSMELNFKHLLGRAPASFEEMKIHSRILDEQGFEADIDFFLDSDEYQSVFGENVVPYYQGYSTQTGRRLLGFTNTLDLVPSLSGSDRDLTGGNEFRVAKQILFDTPAGQAKPVDVRELMREALAENYALVRSVPGVPGAVPSPDIQALEAQIAEQDDLLATLRRQLAEVSPFAAVGSSTLGLYNRADGTAQTNGGVANGTGGTEQQALQATLTEKTEQVARLQERLQDARRLAVVGFAKTNRWRRTTFSR